MQDLAWFGRCKNLYSCKFLQLQSMQRRLQVVQQARQGGSISPEAMAQLQTWIDSGHLEIRTGVDFKGAAWDASVNRWKVAFHAGTVLFCVLCFAVAVMVRFFHSSCM